MRRVLVPPSIAQVATRNAALWPFASDSPWNTPIGSGAVLAEYPQAHIGGDMNYGSWSCELSIHDPSAPLLTITQANECNQGSPFSETPPQFRSPASYNGSPPMTCYRDGYADFLHTDGYIYGFHNFRRTSDTTGLAAWHSAHQAMEHVVTGAGWKLTPGFAGTGLWIGGCPFVAGIIRKWEIAEIAAGTRKIINHALSCVYSRNQLKTRVNDDPTTTFVWPASWSDSSGAYYTGTIPVGALLTIPQTFNIEAQSWSAPTKAIARTIQRYGCYVVGEGGQGWLLYVELNANQNATAETIRNELSSVAQQLKVVSNNGPNSVGGGGTYPSDLWPPPDPVFTP